MGRGLLRDWQQHKATTPQADGQRGRGRGQAGLRELPTQQGCL